MKIINILIICLVGVTSLLYGETAYGQSNIFSFPEIVGVTTHQYVPKSAFFKTTALHPYSKVVTFSWYFPSLKTSNQGMITIYSLQGKVVERISVQQNSGTAVWNINKSPCQSGIYIAGIHYGKNRQNLKLMLWN